MKLVYANESRFLVNNMKELFVAQEIEVFIKNEFAQGAVGEISPFDSWPELWVVNDSDVERATQIVNLSKHSNNDADWICKSCAETNDPSFDVCWNCQRENDYQVN